MSLSLENIIQNIYDDIVKGNTPAFFNKKHHLAALVLAEIYEKYEKHKETTLVTELGFFLSIKNPIKHIFNILENSSSRGGMRLKDAILEEYITIKHEKELDDKVTLLSVISSEIDRAKSRSHSHLQNANMIASTVIEKLNEYRVKGNLDQDTCFALCQPDIKESIVRIIEMSNAGGNKVDLISAFYRKLDEKKSGGSEALDSLLARFKLEFQTIVQSECVKLHDHMAHVGETTFNTIVYGIENGDSQHRDTQLPQHYEHHNVNKYYDDKEFGRSMAPETSRKNLKSRKQGVGLDLFDR